MRSIFGLALLLCACGTEVPSTFATPCDEATHLIATCGAAVPFLSTRSCTGIARFTATCITRHATDCDSLATLSSRLEECMPDAGEGLFPTAEDLQFPVAHSGLDAGANP